LGLHSEMLRWLIRSSEKPPHSFLFTHANSVFAVIISEKGLKLLEQNHVSAEFQNIVPTVLNRERTGVCPFEKMVLNCRDAKEAFGILGNVFKQTE
jgi:hypothetical protein